MIGQQVVKRPYIRQAEQGEPLRRFKDHARLNPAAVVGLSPAHPAVITGRTIFPRSVVDPREAPRVLVDGINQRKLGSRVAKGLWRGMPLFALTLEERATCPQTCHHWADCFGNAMPFSRRHAAGLALVAALDRELATKQRKHPRGFVVRLHLLGDFYSLDYVRSWERWLDKYPALRVFGYSAREAGTEIGDALIALRDDRWERFAVRTSSVRPAPTRAVTIDYIPTAARVREGIVCPAQTERSACCASCGLCWAPLAKHETIVFVKHGPSWSGRRAAA